MPVSRNNQQARARPSFTRDELARAALRFIDRHGLDALTMRALAAEVGMGTMSLYRYFDTKEALLDAVTEAAMPAFTGPRPDAGDWRAEIRRVFTDLLQGLERHPALVRLRLERVPRTSGALGWTEAVLRLLRSAGFSRREAVSAYRALYTYTFGFAAFAAAETRAREAIEGELAALPTDQFPLIVASVGDLVATLGSRRQFEFGLRRLLDGLAQGING
jgi:AcrR family transcriptional regulator